MSGARLEMAGRSTSSASVMSMESGVASWKSPVVVETELVSSAERSGAARIGPDRAETTNVELKSRWTRILNECVTETAVKRGTSVKTVRGSTAPEALERQADRSGRSRP